MASNTPVTPFRLTPDDLPDLDKKTKNAIQPLLDGLNVTLNELVNAVNALPKDEVKAITLSTQDTVAASFPLRFITAVTQPRIVVLANIVPKDPNHVLTTPFVMQGYQLTDQGQVSIPAITGLLPLNTYVLTFWIR